MNETELRRIVYNPEYEWAISEGLKPLEDEGRIYGYKIREAGPYELHAVRMIYNWRLAECDSPVPIRRAWCYDGIGISTFRLVVASAREWEWSLDTMPEGWVKNPMTGERRGHLLDEHEARLAADVPPDSTE